MTYTRASGSWLLLASALSASSFGCAAQGSEDYLGEPLLELHGSAIITGETGGEAVAPALCFTKGAPMLLPDSADHLPADIRDVMKRPIDVGKALNAVSDEVGLWTGAQLTEIVPVESVGHFPAEFNIAAYLPPSDAFVAPLFEGEPPVAEGTLCAVREGHPDVVNKPYMLQGSRCENGEEGQCDFHWAFLSYDDDAYYVESLHCPSIESSSDECERTSQGDVTVRRNLQGSFIEGRAEPAVVYLTAPAKAGSYTAWKYGSPDGLSAGFHLFQYPSFETITDRMRDRSASCRAAYGDALTQIREEYADRLHTVEMGGLVVDNVYIDPVLRNAFESRLAELTMERCPMQMIEPVSHTEPLTVHFSNPAPVPTLADLRQSVSPP